MIRTDLAIEAHEFLLESTNEVSGADVTENDSGDIKITTVKIETDESAQKLNKPKGKYITIDMPDMLSGERREYERMCEAVSFELKELLQLKKDDKILVIGLGNRKITPDSLGPEAVSLLMITRHLFSYVPEAMTKGMRSVSAISPGVLGITGMETGEIVKGVCEKIKPDKIIAIDALASRSLSRISKTVQLCDTGISPGAGVGNKRKELSKETLGVPVIAIGVPTVIDAQTIAFESIDKGLGELFLNEKSGTNKSLTDALLEEKKMKLSENMPEHLKSFMVTPKDVDSLILKTAKILANAINLALHENLTIEDIEAFLA